MSQDGIFRLQCPEDWLLGRIQVHPMFQQPLANIFGQGHYLSYHRTQPQFETRLAHAQRSLV
jgi:hypothetical protein